MRRSGNKRRVVPSGPGPWRTCIGCRAVRKPDDPVRGLVRFTRTFPENEPISSENDPINIDRINESPSPDCALDLPQKVAQAGTEAITDAGLYEMSRHGPGRGAWLCRAVSGTPDSPHESVRPNESCLAAAIKRQAFSKALRVTK
jgi:predicted RNA-binding protein YlxR (DUF448 family)